MKTATAATDTPRAWVGCLGCYNNGDLVGEWINGTECADLVAAGLTYRPNVAGLASEICRRCGAEEFWVMDHEGFPTAVLSGECSPVHFAELTEAWEAVEFPEMVAAYLENSGETVTAENLPELIEQAEERYTGYETVLEYAESYLEDSGLLAEVPETLRYYVDTEAFARDLVLGGEVFECDGYVFRNY
jgi:antirestriction protein